MWQKILLFATHKRPSVRLIYMPSVGVCESMTAAGSASVVRRGGARRSRGGDLGKLKRLGIGGTIPPCSGPKPTGTVSSQNPGTGLCCVPVPNTTCESFSGFPPSSAIYALPVYRQWCHCNLKCCHPLSLV